MSDFLVEPLKKLCRQQKVTIDNWVFRLHYQVTVILFILFSMLFNAMQCFGDPIDCMVDGVEAKIVNTFCWIHGTYTLKNYKMDQVGIFILLTILSKSILRHVLSLQLNRHILTSWATQEYPTLGSILLILLKTTKCITPITSGLDLFWLFRLLYSTFPITYGKTWKMEGFGSAPKT